jgi:hypothetical protein
MPLASWSLRLDHDHKALKTADDHMLADAERRSIQRLRTPELAVDPGIEPSGLHSSVTTPVLPISDSRPTVLRA